jgi:hypothetical protein
MITMAVIARQVISSKRAKALFFALVNLLFGVSRLTPRHAPMQETAQDLEGVRRSRRLLHGGANWKSRSRTSASASAVSTLRSPRAKKIYGNYQI